MATNVTRSCLLSSTTTSFAPFLYHTQTLLSHFAPRRQRLDYRSPRPYSTETNAVEANEPTDNRPSEDKPNQVVSDNTRAIEQGFLRARRSLLHQRAASASKKPLKTNPSPVKRPNKQQRAAPKVTSQEKAVFSSLLAQIGLKHDGESAAVDSTLQLSEAQKTELAELKSMFEPLLKDPRQKEASVKAEARRKRAEQAALERQQRQEARVEAYAKTEAERLIAEETGPRRVRIRDLGYSEAATPTLRSHEPTITLREAIELVIKNEFEHTEFLLFQAIDDHKGDLGVWEVCKDRIFSMLNHLDEKSLEEAIDPESANVAASPDTTIRGKGPLRVPAVVPVGPVVVGLYPKSLLVAFRLLNTYYPNSPLIPEFRSTIKEYGRVSAFLGASAGLYDELIHYHWRVCQDLPAVVSILDEMNQLGINPNHKTHKLLIELIVRQRREMGEHRKAPNEKGAFWKLPSTKAAFDELTCEGGWMDQIETNRLEDERRQSRLSHN